MSREDPRKAPTSPGKPRRAKRAQKSPVDLRRAQTSPGEPLDCNGSRAGVAVKCLRTQIAAASAENMPPQRQQEAPGESLGETKMTLGSSRHQSPQPSHKI